MTTQQVPDQAIQDRAQQHGRPGQGPRPQQRSLARVMTVLGSVLLLTILGSAALALAVGSGGSDRAEQTTPVDGVDSLRISASAGELIVGFADVAEAQLEATGRGADRWQLTTSGEELSLTRSNGWLPDISWFGGWWTDPPTIRLTLPRELEGTLDTDLRSSAGSIRFDGDLREVSIGVSAGNVTFTGASTSMEISVSAGSANVTTSGPSTLGIEVTAGRVEAAIDGDAPQQTKVDVSSGSAVVTLPDATYAVSEDRTAGSSTVDLRTDPNSTNTVEVRITAGSAHVSY